ncbi:MAG: Fe-S oxidoreductase [Chloroflexi bacterium]|nr:Fe-S oxidoreductase [Chloroflexota bacterium]
MKLGAFYRQDPNNEVKLALDGRLSGDFKPDLILITSSFTYWYKPVWDSVSRCRALFPDAKIIVGGIYASLMPEHCKQSGCDEVFVGIHNEAEICSPAYDLLSECEFQIIHTSRGCFRQCPYCGVWKIEKNVTYKNSILREIKSKHIVFYDNNLLANPNIERILSEIAFERKKGRSIHCESQCGIDARLLKKETATQLKEAGFINMRIAWGWSYNDWNVVKESLDLLHSCGFRKKDLYVFMIYNWEVSFSEMEKKRLKCWEWQVQIADCRYRPLDQTVDNYDPKLEQTSEDYFIHRNWTDLMIKEFRKNVRRQNICVRHGFPFCSKGLERNRFDKELSFKLRTMKPSEVKALS